MSKLRDAYELIRDPERWTTHTLAVDADDEPASPLSPRAVRWCAEGALQRAGCSGPLVLGSEWRTLSKVARELFGWNSVVHVNDNFGHEAVVQMFEKALTETEGGL